MRAGGSILIKDAAITNPEANSPRIADIDIRNGKITAIGENLPHAEEQLIIDANRRTTIPGLIDAHFHAYAVSIDDAKIESFPMSYVVLKSTIRLRDALRRGFTTVRDVAGGDIGVARAIDEKIISGPRYLFTGPAMSQTGGHGDPRGVFQDISLDFKGGRSVLIVDGAENVRLTARQLFRVGAHAIKMLISGGVISPSDPLMAPQYSHDEICAAVEVASSRGSYVTVHAYSKAAIEMAIECGVRCIEHGNFLDEEAASLMAQQNVFLVPTLVAYDAMNRRGSQMGLTPIELEKNTEVYNSGFRALRIAQQNNVKIGFGSDLMGDLADEQLRGLQLQSKAIGVSETLKSATSVNAEILGCKNIGEIEVGKCADLVILDGNLAEDESLLWDETRKRIVIKDGMEIK